MRRLEWSIEAKAEYRRILQFIAEDNPIGAGRVATRIEAAIRRLRYFNSGRPGRVEGTYEKVVAKTSCIVAYTLRSSGGRQTLYIVHVVHMARDWPAGVWPAGDA